MCPVCVAKAAVLVAGAGSTGGAVAFYLRKLRIALRSDRKETWYDDQR